MSVKAAFGLPVLILTIWYCKHRGLAAAIILNSCIFTMALADLPAPVT